MTQEEKPKRWRGLLADEQTVIRRAVTIVLLLLAASLPFGPMGFFPVGNAHVLVSIIPVALGSLLFGMWRGCIIGAVAGLAEMIRAIYQPLDYYEKYFSLPQNSVVLLALLGLGLGPCSHAPTAFLARTAGPQTARHRLTWPAPRRFWQAR